MSECSGPDCDHPSHQQAHLQSPTGRITNLGKIPAGRRPIGDPRVRMVIDEIVDVDYSKIEKRVQALFRRSEHNEKILKSAVIYAVTQWMASEIALRRQRALDRDRKTPLKVVE